MELPQKHDLTQLGKESTVYRLYRRGNKEWDRWKTGRQSSRWRDRQGGGRWQADRKLEIARNSKAWKPEHKLWCKQKGANAQPWLLACGDKWSCSQFGEWTAFRWRWTYSALPAPSHSRWVRPWWTAVSAGMWKDTFASGLDSAGGGKPEHPKPACHSLLFTFCLFPFHRWSRCLIGHSTGEIQITQHKDFSTVYRSICAALYAFGRTLIFKSMIVHLKV